ncbi:MAG: DUF1425 domain-containing protein [Alphaproteobacteria bacterium]
MMKQLILSGLRGVSRVAATVLLLAVVVGCAAQGRSTMQSPQWSGDIRFGDNLGWLSYNDLEVRESVTSTGLKSLVVTVHNPVSHHIELNYRATWYDASGQSLVTALSRWQKLHVDRSTFGEMRMIAPSEKAENWRLEILSAHNTQSVGPAAGRGR